MQSVAKALLCLFLLAGTLHSQEAIQSKVDVEQTSAILAASADVQPLDDKVAVFLVDREPGIQSGLMIKVTSNARFIGVRAYKIQPFGFVSVSKLQNGNYVLFGDPGAYWISVTFSDPELGLDYKDVQATIAGGSQPEQPTDPIPPDSDNLTQLEQKALQIAKELNDPETAKKLAEAYATASRNIADTMSLVDAENIVVSARRAALLLRVGKSRDVEWDKFITGVDGLVKQIKQDSGVKGYRSAIMTLAVALDKSI